MSFHLTIDCMTYRYSSSLLRILLLPDLPDGGREFFPLELVIPLSLEADEGRWSEVELGRDAFNNIYVIIIIYRPGARGIR